MGLNCISSYVPWILHEEKEGEFNFSGNLDLSAFLDLCAEKGLYVFIRPGPYIMAEMKKEGIPFWVSEKYPDALPVGFHDERRECNTLDYLHEGYLRTCQGWYREVMKIIVPGCRATAAASSAFSLTTKSACSTGCRITR